MSAGVACYVQNCSEPVVGQCQGYEGGCGHFYCRTHADGKLCAECQARKAAADAEVLRRVEQSRQEEAAHAEMERLYHDYTRAAKSINEKVDSVGCMLPLFLFFLGVGVFYGAAYMTLGLRLSGGDDAKFAIGVTVAYTILAFAIWLRDISNREKRRKAMAAALETEKPGFSKFFEAWDKAETEEGIRKNRESLKRAVGVALVVGGVAVSAANEYRRQQAYNELHETAEALKDINRKL